MEKVFVEKENGFKNIEPLSWKVLQRHNNAPALEALKHFTSQVAHKVRKFDSQYSSCGWLHNQTQSMENNDCRRTEGHIAILHIC
jgi:hypothetical protein